MANIITRERNGKKWYSVVIKDQYGRRHEIKAGGTKKAAENLRTRLEQEVAAGTFNPREDPSTDIAGSSTVTFANFSETFLKEKEQEVKQSTVDSYAIVIRLYLAPYFGPIVLADITPMMIRSWMDDMADKEKAAEMALEGASRVKYHAASRRRALKYLRIMLRRAVALELLDRDPTLAIRPPKIERKEMDYLTPDEARGLIETLSGPLKAIVGIATYAGLRQSEILGLRWQDISLEKRTITIRQAYRPRYGFQSPKTDASRRTVPMIGPLVEILAEHHQAQESPSPDALVFTSSSSGPIDARNMVQREFEPALQRAEIRRIRFHDLRHTFASLCAEAGVDLKTLQAALGHADLKTTADTYTHLYTSAFERMTASLERLVDAGPKVIQFPASEAVGE